MSGSCRPGRLTLAANELTCLYLLPLCTSTGGSTRRARHGAARPGQPIPGQVLDFGADLGVVTFRPDLDLLTSIVVYRDELAFVVPPSSPLRTRPA